MLAIGSRPARHRRLTRLDHEDIRIQALMGARRNGNMDRMTGLVDRCMAEYDEKGWTGG